MRCRRGYGHVVSDPQRHIDDDASFIFQVTLLIFL
jgi:hypothetical protein